MWSPVIAEVFGSDMLELELEVKFDHSVQEAVMVDVKTSSRLNF